MATLRDYQSKLISGVRASLQTHDRTLAVLPTGGGKTICFSHMAGRIAEAASSATILVHRFELIDQASRALDRFGIGHGIIAASHPDRYQPAAPIQIASVHTLSNRLGSFAFDPSFLIVDEAHHSVAGQWEKIIAHCAASKVIGFTATPCRLDGKGLGGAYQDMVIGPSVGELIDQGHLTPYRVYAPSAPDLSELRRNGGDWSKSRVEEAVNRSTITGDAVRTYARLCPYVPAVAFCVSVEHARRTAAAFEAAGFKAGLLLGEQSKEERDEVVAKLSCGAIHVACSVDVVSEGFDLPAIGCAIMLRPTASESLFLQQAGRALRPCAGKEVAYLLDHAGNHLRHGFVDDLREWSLEGGLKRKQKGKAGPGIKQCPECYFVHRPASACPACGHVYESASRGGPKEVDGDLVEIQGQRMVRRREQGRAKSLQDLVKLGQERGYKNPYVWAKMVFEGRQGRR